MEITNYHNNYKIQINRYKKGINELKEHQIYELLWAIENNMILWNDIPPGFDEIYSIPTMMDHGIDLISLKFDRTSQVKHYGPNSQITYSHISNYFSYSKQILNIDNMILNTTPEAKICKMADRLMRDCIKVERKSFQEMIDKIEEIEINNEIRNDFFEIEQRDYLVDCTNIFMESKENLLKYQLPCGTGKSFIIYNIILRDLEESEESDEKYIIFVPWIDLAIQMKRDATKIGINCCMIGGMNKKINDECNVIICVNPSVENIPDWDFKYKFIDEAHHLDNEDSKLRKKIDEICSEKTLELSATFKSDENIHYEMTLRDAIELGYLCDYVLHIEYFTSGDKWKAMLDMIKNNIMWTPTFIYFNSTEKAKKFAEDLQGIGLIADFLIGTDNKFKRDAIRTKVENYELHILCLCGMYNEGISINNLATVIFADLRHSEINRIQVAMRASRKHKNKSYFRIVLPIIESDFDENDMSDLVNTFFRIDPKLKDSFKNKSRTRINVVIDDKKIEEESSLIYEEVYNRIGELINISRIEEKVDELLEWVEKNMKIPARNNTVLFRDGRCKGAFWKHCISDKNKILVYPYNKLLTNDILKNNYEKYLEIKENNKNKVKLSIEEKIEDILKTVEKIQMIPQVNKKILFSDNCSQGVFWQQCKIHKKIYKSPYDKLLSNSILKDDFDNYIKFKKNKLSTEEKITEFLITVETTKKIPKINRSFLFTDMKCQGSFWKECKTENKCSNFPYDKLLSNSLLKKNYEEYLKHQEKNKDKIKLSTNEKISELLSTVERIQEIPQKNSFWKFCKFYKKCSIQPYDKLLDNPILKKNYDEYLKLNESNKINVKITEEQKINEFLLTIEKIQKIPVKNNNILFSDMSSQYRFWQYCKNSEKCSHSPYDKLLQNKILKKNYEEIIKLKEKNKNIIKLSSEEKVNIFLEKVNEINKIPPQNNNFFLQTMFL